MEPPKRGAQLALPRVGSPLDVDADHSKPYEAIPEEAVQEQTCDGHERLSANSPSSWLPVLRPLSRGIGGSASLIIGTTSPAQRGIGGHQRSELRSTVGTLSLDRRCIRSITMESLPSAGAQTPAERRHRPPALESPMQRAVSDTALLSGVTPAVQLENARASRLFGMTQQEPRTSFAGPPSTNARKISVSPAKQNGVISITDGIARAINQLMEDHETFDPRSRGPTRVVLTLGQSGPRGNSVAVPSGEEADRLAERLEAYKMARRIEPELPPLSNDFEFGRQRPEQSIVHRNTMPEAMQRFAPENRRCLLMNRREEDREHRQAMALQRATRHEEVIEQYVEVLEKKKMKAEAALAARRAKKSSKRFAVDRWFTILAVISTLDSLYEEIQLSKMEVHERLTFVETGVIKSRRHSTMVLSQALFYNELLGNAKLVNGLRLICCIFRVKRRILDQRRNARVVHSSLSCWKIGGNVLLSIKHLALQIKKLQAWWRQCVRQLRSLREGISKRWEKIEKREVLMELGKGKQITGEQQPRREREKDKKAPSKIKVFDSEVQDQMLSEAVRMQFIAQELRNRRRSLMPKILLCEEDTRKFKLQVQSMLETRAIHRAMGIEPPDDTPTYVGMDRPSYLPPAHLQIEARGGACPEWCLGRHGDEEILAMVHAARGGRAEVHRHCADSRSPTKGAAQSGRRRTKGGRHPTKGGSRHSHVEQASPFGKVVADEELRSWGADPEDMPLLGSGTP